MASSVDSFLALISSSKRFSAPIVERSLSAFKSSDKVYSGIFSVLVKGLPSISTSLCLTVMEYSTGLPKGSEINLIFSFLLLGEATPRISKRNLSADENDVLESAVALKNPT